MTIVECGVCTSFYARQIGRCPNCGTVTEPTDQEDTVPKISRHAPPPDLDLDLDLDLDVDVDESSTEETMVAPDPEQGSTRPPLGATKSEWVAYAATAGADDTVLSGTKTGIIEWCDRNVPETVVS